MTAKKKKSIDEIIDDINGGKSWDQIVLELTKQKKYKHNAEIFEGMYFKGVGKISLTDFDLPTLRTKGKIVYSDGRGSINFGPNLNLSKKDLSGTVIFEMNLENTNFSRTSFKGSTLSSAYFWENNFRHANFTGADLSLNAYEHCDFSNANFTRADLSHSKFTDCKFNAAVFNQAICDQTFFQGCSFNNAEFTKMPLNETSFQGGLAKVKFEKVILNSVEFRFCSNQMPEALIKKKFLAVPEKSQPKEYFYVGPGARLDDLDASNFDMSDWPLKDVTFRQLFGEPTGLPKGWVVSMEPEDFSDENWTKAELKSAIKSGYRKLKFVPAVKKK